MPGIYLRTDILEEACRNAEFVDDRINRAQNDPYEWKWVILGLHGALQSVMAAALRDSAGINVLRPRIRRRLLKALQENGARPDERLDDFLRLCYPVPCIRF